MSFYRRRALFFLSFMAVIALAPVKNRHSGFLKKQKPPRNESELWSHQQLQDMSLEEKIGQFFMVAAYPDMGEEQLNQTVQRIRDEKVGGIIFFQGERISFSRALKRFNEASKLPLFIGMDAEWGTNMRLLDGERFPYAYTLGAANDTSCTARIASLMAQECRGSGIHINFSPVADVHSVPDNPVIGFRSFGQDPNQVAAHVSAFVRATEAAGLMSCLKHFPGHGATDKDSHLELPVLNRSETALQNIDLLPFKSGISSGAGSVMMAHLNVPALDSSGKPSSLSSKMIQVELLDRMQFKGLIFSDALNMKAVAENYGKDDVALRAFEAGCDILLCPEDLSGAKQRMMHQVREGKISMKEIDRRCLKILAHKYRYIISPPQFKKYTEGERLWRKQEVFDKALTVLKNSDGLLPFKKLDQNVLRISIGMHTSFLRDQMALFDDVPSRHYFTLKEALKDLKDTEIEADVIVYSLHPTTVRPKNHFGLGVSSEELKHLPKGKSTVLVLFGNPLYLSEDPSFDGFDAVLVAYENNRFSQISATHFIYGAMASNGQLPFTIRSAFPNGFGLKLPWEGRLKFSQPEEVGISSAKLSEIDHIVEHAIEMRAFPGCQIAIAVKGKIIYRKSFGKPTYEDSVCVKSTDLYDLASVSKIAASTAGLMYLQSMGKFDLDKQMKYYLPELTSGSAYGLISLRDMMAHQAGLSPWIPFYKRTIKSGKLDPNLYVTTPVKGFSTPVAKDLYIKDSYSDSIYAQILQTPLGQRKYEYSDLGYYFIKKIVESQSGRVFEEFLDDNLYAPMGLRTMCYHPLRRFKMNEIMPTENDLLFRRQMVRGFVHDPGAAMLGGVGGHAGVFSNATDLASLMQLFLNGGYYGGIQYIQRGVIEEYTKGQFPGNRRGAGFDRPTANGGGPCHAAASQQSFGHTGFTGTMTWVDPKYGMNYVFLSNRVYPDQGNWKIRDMNVRTEIQRVIYEAITGSM